MRLVENYCCSAAAPSNFGRGRKVLSAEELPVCLDRGMKPGEFRRCLPAASTVPGVDRRNGGFFSAKSFGCKSTDK